MRLVVRNTKSLAGSVTIPGSKSHTIRGLVIASLAEGKSILKNPLRSADTLSAVSGCASLGAMIDASGSSSWIIDGVSGKPSYPKKPLDLGNSGTSMNLLISVASLLSKPVTLTGDASLQKRPVGPLLDALSMLGVSSASSHGMPPVTVHGPLRGGKTKVIAKSSQYVTSLLLACPLAEDDTEITVLDPCEIPYIKMTLSWLDSQGISYKRDGVSKFWIRGRQSYNASEKMIPADWSSAAFPLVASALLNSPIAIRGLDASDTQGDKKILAYLKKAGAKVTENGSTFYVESHNLKGAELDLNETPDALPAISVLACGLDGATKITNVAHARIKETDRISVMACELGKMKAKVKETEDGLLIEKSELVGCEVDGHHDHRVVMALAVAGLFAKGTTTITSSESISVTFPGFIDMMRSVGADMEEHV